jgi:hypothetical protein
MLNINNQMNCECVWRYACQVVIAASFEKAVNEVISIFSLKNTCRYFYRFSSPH